MTAELEARLPRRRGRRPAAFGAFLTDIVGLVPGETTADGATTWRDDDRVHRIIVERGAGERRRRSSASRPRRPDAFERAVDRARRRRRRRHRRRPPRTAAPPGRAARPRRDAVGRPVEIVHGLGHRAGRRSTRRWCPAGFLTKGQGFGHVVFVAPDLDSADRFARRGARLRPVGLARDGPRRDRR